MNVSELYELTEWIEEEIKDAGIVGLYQQLHSILKRHTQPNQAKPTFEDQRKELISALKEVPLLRLSGEQKDFLENMGIAEAVGQAGISKVEDILFRNVIDVSNSVQELSEIINKLNSAITKSDQLKSCLHGNVSYEGYETDDKVLIRVTFDHGASISNVKDFKSWASVWYDIGRGIAMAHGQTPEDIDVVGAGKGSIIIELAVAAAIAKTTSSIIMEGLKVAERVIKIRQESEKLKGMQLSNKKLALDLAKEAEKEKNVGIEKVIETAVQESNLNQENEGDKVTALGNSVKKLVSFVENGGVVDFVVPDTPEDKETEESKKQKEELSSAFQEIRKLERKIALLEQKKAQQDS